MTLPTSSFTPSLSRANDFSRAKFASLCVLSAVLLTVDRERFLADSFGSAYRRRPVRPAVGFCCCLFELELLLLVVLAVVRGGVVNRCDGVDAEVGRP